MTQEKLKNAFKQHDGSSENAAFKQFKAEMFHAISFSVFQFHAESR